MRPNKLGNNEIEYTVSRLSSPWRLFFLMLTVIFCVEMLIMFLILPTMFRGVDGVVANVADSLLLTLLSSPFLWMFIIRPLRMAAMRLEEKTKQLLKAEEELALKEKLAILGQLSGSVGHELRNPLGIISNAVFYLQSVLSDADGSVKEYLEIITQELDNSQRIISDLLDFSRTRTPQTKPVIVGELVEHNLGRCVISENVAVRIAFPDALPKVNVDPLQMGQVLQNLITNAVQAMPEGGELRISARRAARVKGQGARENIEAGQGASVKESQKEKTTCPYPDGSSLDPCYLTLDPDGDFIEIAVSDTGQGISPENMDKLFQPLFTTKAKGIGLGLIVCRSLVEANGGRIEVESELGKGTTFIVTLPVKGNEK